MLLVFGIGALFFAVPYCSRLQDCINGACRDGRLLRHEIGDTWSQVLPLAIWIGPKVARQIVPRCEYCEVLQCAVLVICDVLKSVESRCPFQASALQMGT